MQKVLELDVLKEPLTFIINPKPYIPIRSHSLQPNPRSALLFHSFKLLNSTSALGFLSVCYNRDVQIRQNSNKLLLEKHAEIYK